MACSGTVGKQADMQSLRRGQAGSPGVTSGQVSYVKPNIPV